MILLYIAQSAMHHMLYIMTKIKVNKEQNKVKKTQIKMKCLTVGDKQFKKLFRFSATENHKLTN